MGLFFDFIGGYKMLQVKEVINKLEMKKVSERNVVVFGDKGDEKIKLFLNLYDYNLNKVAYAKLDISNMLNQISILKKNGSIDEIIFKSIDMLYQSGIKDVELLNYFVNIVIQNDIKLIFIKEKLSVPYKNHTELGKMLLQNEFMQRVDHERYGLNGISIFDNKNVKKRRV